MLLLKFAEPKEFNRDIQKFVIASTPMGAVPEERPAWHRVREVLYHALEIAPDLRRAYLDKECQNEPSLRREVESLIQASEKSAVIDQDVAAEYTNFTSLLDQPTVVAAQRVPLMLGPYKILGSIGAGGMGAVFKAVDQRLDRVVALKVLAPDKESVQDRRRLAREAKAASALNHPNIVTIYEFGSTDETDFIAMEYVDGVTLCQMMADGAESLANLLEYARQTSDAIAKAHAAGIVHRDLKPANVMVTPEGIVKVLDFGLAKVLAAHAEGDAEGLLITTPGAVLGTPAYMSPEQVMGEAADFRTDIFSLGVILYEMVCGHRPFAEENAGSTLRQIVLNRPAPVKQEQPNAPPLLAGLIEKCLQKKREERPQSMAEISQVLRGVVAELRKGHLTEDVSHTFASRRNWIAFAVVGAAFGGGVLAAWRNAANYSAAVSSPRTVLHYAIETQRMQNGQPDGKPYVASSAEIFHGGWKFRLMARPAASGYLYLVSLGAGEQGKHRYWLLYPTRGTPRELPLRPEQEIRTGWYVFDENPGVERLWIIWSSTLQPELEQQIRRSESGRVPEEMAPSLRTFLAALHRNGSQDGKLIFEDGTGISAALLELTHR